MFIYIPLIILILLLCIKGYALYKNPQNKFIGASVTPGQTPNIHISEPPKVHKASDIWEVYTNTNHYYSISFPKEIDGQKNAIYERQGEKYNRTDSWSLGYVGWIFDHPLISIDSQNSNSDIFNWWVDNVTNTSDKTFVKDYTNITEGKLGNNKALIVRYTAPIGMEDNNVIYLISKNNINYAVTVWGLDKTDIINRILSSFKITR